METHSQKFLKIIGVGEVADEEVIVEKQAIKQESEPEIESSWVPSMSDIEMECANEKTKDENKEPEVVTAKQDPHSDSEDEKPLATLVPKYRLKKIASFVEDEETCSDSQIRFIEHEPLEIKSEPEEFYMDESSQTELSEIEEIPLENRKRKQKFICSFCGDSFRRRSILKKHKRAVHSDMKWNHGPFVCEICGKSYATNTTLICHRNRHQEYQRFKCDECPKAFFFRCYLETHKRLEHRQEWLICQLCGKQFKFSEHLKVHIKHHDEDKPFKCSQCPSRFQYPSALRSHKACHEKTVFSCDMCNKTFKYSNSLRVHKQLHSNIKRFRCEICDRAFATKASMLRHLAVHSVEREMKCIVCDRIFYKKVDLVIHQSKEHPNNPLIGKTVKIHTCEICGQEFSTKSKIKTHSTIHGDVYKYKCKLCDDRQFKQYGGLRHHMASFHKMKLSRNKTKANNEKEIGPATGTNDREASSTVLTSTGMTAVTQQSE